MSRPDSPETARFRVLARQHIEEYLAEAEAYAAADPQTPSRFLDCIQEPGADPFLDSLPLRLGPVVRSRQRNAQSVARVGNRQERFNTVSNRRRRINELRQQAEANAIITNGTSKALLEDYIPPEKRTRRMQVGVGNSTNASSTTNTSSTAATNGKSVGERLKEKQKELLANKEAQKNATNNHATPSCSTSERICRTTIPSNIVKNTRPELNERQKNTIRIITQYLKDIGMNDTVEALVDESGCRDETPLALRLRDDLKTDNWSDALQIIDGFKGQIDDTDHTTLRAAIIEEMMKTYLARGNFMGVLACIQQEYPKEKEYEDRRRFYAQLLMEDPEEVIKYYQNKSEVADYNYLISMMQDLLPANFLLAPHRLDDLLHQSYETQVRNCALHIGAPKVSADNNSILRDHCCNALNFPSKTIQIIEDYETEVWVLKFSPCGEYLASAGKAGLVYIWKMRDDLRLQYAHRFVLHEDIEGIGSLSWSSDSRFLACGATEHRSIGIFLYDIRKALADPKHPRNIDPIRVCPEKFSVASFFPIKNRKIVCADQRGNFSIFNTNEGIKEKRNDFDGFRIRALVCLKDGRTVLAADTLNRIRSYDFEKLLDHMLIQETSSIIAFSVDAIERHCLITTKDHGIRLWCLDTHTLIQSFFGSIHSELVVAACFGGYNDCFVASGSEKSNRVMIWKRSEQRPIKYLDGHKRGVNAVAWNPKYHNVLVSGSDDHTIRVWSTSAMVNEYDDLVPQSVDRLENDDDVEDDDDNDGEDVKIPQVFNGDIKTEEE